MTPTTKIIKDMIARCVLAYGEPSSDADLIENGNTQAMCWDMGGELIVAFRGSQLREARSGKWFADWFTNFRCAMADDDGQGGFHAGYLADYNAIEDKLLAWLNTPSRRNKGVTITGHSAGGGLALQLAKAVHSRVALVITYGAPRCSTAKWNRNYDLHSRTYRLVLDDDIVPRLPPIFMGARHLGNLLFINWQDRLIENPPYWRLMVALAAHKPFGPIIDHTAQKYQQVLAKLEI